MTLRPPTPLLLGLVTVPLLLGCNPGDQYLPPFQTVALDAGRGDLRQFEGRWFDVFDGYLMTIVEDGDSPQFSIRLAKGAGLEWARLEGGDLLFRLGDGEGGRTLCLRPVAKDEVVLIPEGGSPSWCATCTPSLERNRSLSKIARHRGMRVVVTFEYACERTGDWLVDVL